MQELLRLQAEYAKDTNRLAKEDKIIQLAQVYNEQKIKQDEDINVKTLTGLEKTLKESMAVQKGLRSDVQDLSKTLKKQTAEGNIQESEKQKESLKQLASNIGSLKEVIDKNIKLFVKSGGGQELGNEVINAEDTAPKASKLRKFLFGKQTTEEINEGSNFGISRGLNAMVTKKEQARDYAAEKEKYVSNILKSNDKSVGVGGIVRNSAGTKTDAEKAEGAKRAKAWAENRFDEIKQEEAKLAKMQRDINAVQGAGFDVTKKVKDARDTQAETVEKIDPRRRAEFKPDSKQVKIEKADKSESQAESESQSLILSTESINAQRDMGKSLIEALDIQKQSLAMLTKIAEKEPEASGSGSGISVDPSNLLSRGSKLGGKAKGFLGRNVGKLAGGAAAIGGGLVLQSGLEAGTDAILGAAGRGNDVVTDEMAAKDKANWNKASLGEKVQSAIPRGIEHVGNFFGFDKLATTAKVDRIKAESEYLSKKEGVKMSTPPLNEPVVSTASKANAEIATVAGGSNSPTVISAPTTNNVSNSTTVSGNRSPIRNQDSTINTYVNHLVTP